MRDHWRLRPGVAALHGFTRRDSNGVIIWRGHPTDQAGHDALRKWMADHCPGYPLHAESLSTSVMGNLGEAIAYCVGYWHHLQDCRPYEANALNPLSAISKPDIDVVWIRFGETAEDDVALLQEVKTTGDPTLAITDSLLADYGKLFGRDPKLTLHTRLQYIKNVIEFREKLPDLCPRVALLAGHSPNSSPKIGLIPTVVHESEGASPCQRMAAVKSTLVGRGWSYDLMEAWAIGMPDLNSRLLSLATGG